uniref:Uncharacterized protein n=1 Tax=Calidris pygmaea TaxID=425635 RepID=A0A8C3KR84_9CHAR
MILYALLLLTLYIMLSRKIATPGGCWCLTCGSCLLLQGPRSTENLNYTSVVFPGKGHGPGSAGDYENMKTGVDYVNVDPKKRKVDFWPCSSPVASKSIEYTEVKL